LKKKFKNLFEIKNIIIPDPDQFYHIVWTCSTSTQKKRSIGQLPRKNVAMWFFTL